jgi:hypothetical protein
VLLGILTSSIKAGLSCFLALRKLLKRLIFKEKLTQQKEPRNHGFAALRA